MKESSPGEKQAPEEGLEIRPGNTHHFPSAPLKSAPTFPPPVNLTGPSERTPQGTAGGNTNNSEKRLSLLSNSPTPTELK